MKADKKSFLLYYEYRQHIKLLTDEQLGRLIRALFDFEIDGIIPDFSDAPIISMCFSFISADMERNKSHYEDMCSKNSTNGAKGGRPSKKRTVIEKTEKSERFFEKPKKADKEKDNDKDKDKGKEEEKEEDKESEPKGALSDSKSFSDFSFSPPTVDEVKAYCTERGNSIDAETFVNYYAACGWTIRGEKVKNWKALVNLWEKRENHNIPENSSADEYEDIVDLYGRK